MSGGFSFPPPPPPPPRAGGGEKNRQSNFRGQERGGGRGWQGRGSSSHRGRGGHAGPGSFHNTSNLHSNPHAIPSAQNADLPNGAYINPTFTTSKSVRTWNTHQGQSRAPSSRQNNVSEKITSASPPRTFAGQKRKLEVLRGPSKEKKPAVPSAPATPNFSDSLPSLKYLQPPQSSVNTTLPKYPGQERIQSHSRSLGLTPAVNGPQYSSTSENEDDVDDDLDEEAAFAELGDKLTFEHNGVVTSLKSHADLIAWKKERQTKWPTKDRVVGKEEERRKVGAERVRLLAAASALYEPSCEQPRTTKTSATQILAGNQNASSTDAVQQESEAADRFQASKIEQARISLGSQKQALEDLRRKVAASAAKNRQSESHLRCGTQLWHTISESA